MPVSFTYHPDLFERFPNLKGGIIRLISLRNQPSPPWLQTAFADEQHQVLERIGDFSPAEIPSLAAWRSAFRSFGVEPTKYRCAAEALLRRLSKKGDIPSINALVDSYNLISIRYSLPMAAFDLCQVNGGICVRYANGTERFTPHDSVEIEHPEPGEVIFVDDSGLIFARRWCWKQSAQSASSLETSEALITIEAHHRDGEKDVRRAMTDLLALLSNTVGGEVEWAILNKDRPAF